jgi:prepilin-type N-terminal cleavage/methylation domain-containing protein
MKTRTSGFTLLELLVVLALTASLMAMLFPVFARVREKGRATTCLSNLRQLGMAMAMYAQDADELYPRGTDALSRYSFSQPGNVNPVYQSLPLLTDLLAPYVKNREIWRCPSDIGGNFLLPAPSSAFESFGSSYEYNTPLALKHRLFANGVRMNGKPVESTKLTVLGDISGAWHGSGDLPEENVSNSLMGDGHVRRLSYEEASQASRYPIDND